MCRGFANQDTDLSPAYPWQSAGVNRGVHDAIVWRQANMEREQGE